VTATRMGVLAVGAALAPAVGAPSEGARSVRSACDPSGQLVGRTVVFCGPATARLSIFPGVVFEDGSCDEEGQRRLALHREPGCANPERADEWRQAVLRLDGHWAALETHGRRRHRVLEREVVGRPWCVVSRKRARGQLRRHRNQWKSWPSEWQLSLLRRRAGPEGAIRTAGHMASLANNEEE
jgi:hypothetical protein